MFQKLKQSRPIIPQKKPNSFKQVNKLDRTIIKEFKLKKPKEENYVSKKQESSIVKKFILKYGNSIFDEHPKKAAKILSLGPSAIFDLIDLMKITDKRLEKHIPSTAVGFARKILNKSNQEEREFLLKILLENFNDPSAPFDHIFHVIKDCKDKQVLDNFIEIFNKYSNSSSELSAYELSRLRYSISYFSRSASLKENLKLISLLNNPKNNLLDTAKVSLIYFSLREDISEEDKEILAKEIFKSAFSSNNFFGPKIEILEKGGFSTKTIDAILSDLNIFNIQKINKTLYFNTLQRFFAKSLVSREIIFNILNSASLELAQGKNISINNEKLNTCVNILVNSLKDDLPLNEEEFTKFFNVLKPLTFDQNVDLDIRKKIAVLFLKFPSFLVRGWKSEVYKKSIQSQDPFSSFVFDLSVRPESPKKFLNSSILIVDEDSTYASILTTNISNYLYEKGIYDKLNIFVVDSFLEAQNILLDPSLSVKLLFISEKISIPPSLFATTKPYNSYKLVLDEAARLFNPPFIVLYHGTERAQEIKNALNLYSNLKIDVIYKKDLLTNTQNILKKFEISKTLKEERITVSNNILEYLNHPLVVQAIKKEYSLYADFSNCSFDEPFGKDVLILHRDSYAHIQLKNEPKEERVRFILIMPASQTALLNRSGLKKAKLIHLGGVNLGSNRFSVASKSVGVYADSGGKRPTGKIELMAWEKEGLKIDYLSKGDEVVFIDNTAKGAISYFVNQSSRVVLLKIIEYL
jgi:hypothetical protein